MVTKGGKNYTDVYLVPWGPEKNVRKKFSWIIEGCTSHDESATETDVYDTWNNLCKPCIVIWKYSASTCTILLNILNCHMVQLLNLAFWHTTENTTG